MSVHKANVLAFYDAGHGANTNAVTTSRVVSWLARRDRALLVELVAPVPGLTALDAGCGPGHHTRELVARGLRVTGSIAHRAWSSACARSPPRPRSPISTSWRSAARSIASCAGACSTS
jgi:hypothetical protein